MNMFNARTFMPLLFHMSSASVLRIVLSDTSLKPVGCCEVITALAMVEARFMGHMSTKRLYTLVDVTSMFFGTLLVGMVSRPS